MPAKTVDRLISLADFGTPETECAKNYRKGLEIDAEGRRPILVRQERLASLSLCMKIARQPLDHIEPD
ncbi:MAG: hypothetical protein WA906_04735, partial [Pacificimonas sp.]